MTIWTFIISDMRFKIKTVLSTDTPLRQDGACDHGVPLPGDHGDGGDHGGVGDQPRQGGHAAQAEADIEAEAETASAGDVQRNICAN